MKTVYAIVVNYENFEDTAECIESLLNQSYPCRILLVDNGSNLGIVEKLKNAFPQIEVLRLSENLGYAAGCNAGIRKVIDRSDYIFLVNNDVVLERDTLEKMIREMERDGRIAACQPVVKYYGDDVVWSAGTQLFLGYPKLYLKNKRCEVGTFDPPFGLVGCAMLIRVSALKDVGLFDKTLFMMHEETDWCIRAKKRGYKLLVCRSCAYHKVSKTIGLFSKEYLYYIARNWLIVARKAGFGMFFYALITEPLRILYYFLKFKEKEKIRYYLEGLKDGILGVRGKYENDVRCR